jgi:Dyp-type peroxidase family
MLEISDPPTAKDWIRQAASSQVASAKEVAAFNDLFKAIRARRSEHAIVKSTWMNIAFTRGGLQKLGVQPGDVQRMDASFTQDVTAQARTVLGDIGPSAPEQWHPVYRDQRIDAIIILASDDVPSLNEEEKFFADQVEGHGFAVLATERGEARIDRPGHEHFGFRDGISQPRVNGVGEPAPDALPPWDFLVDAVDNPAPPPSPPGYPAPPPAPPNGPPPWTHQGSYLVFRRLRQFVSAWKDFVEESCPAHMGNDVFAAKLVGRYENGAPFERIASVPTYDPSAGDPGHGSDPTKAEHRDDFTYAADADGMLMPRAAHIRKTNPRDAQFAKKRILRRGIAYGEPYDPEADDNSARGKNADRGLLFACYQRSIGDQFEFIQQQWANKPEFPPPAPPPGIDVLIGQPPDGNRYVDVPQPHGTERFNTIAPFVQTTGTLYCFQPSISALKNLGGA